MYATNKLTSQPKKIKFQQISANGGGENMTLLSPLEQAPGIKHTILFDVIKINR